MGSKPMDTAHLKASNRKYCKISSNMRHYFTWKTLEGKKNPQVPVGLREWLGYSIYLSPHRYDIEYVLAPAHA